MYDIFKSLSKVMSTAANIRWREITQSIAYRIYSNPQFTVDATFLLSWGVMVGSAKETIKSRCQR